jgi:hypothetical protein
MRRGGVRPGAACVHVDDDADLALLRAGHGGWGADCAKGSIGAGLPRESAISPATAAKSRAA